MPSKTLFRPGRAPFRNLLAAFLLASAATAVFADPVTIKSFHAPTEVQRTALKGKWFPVRVGLELKEGDAIRCGKGGKADIKLADGSRITINASSQFRIQSSGSNKLFSLDFGKVKAFVQKLRPGNKFEVKTPIAAASVRGTIFETSYDEESHQGSVDVERGEVAVLAGENEVLVGAGMHLDFLSGQPLGQPVPQGSGDSGADAGDNASVRHEVGLGMSKEEVMAAAAEEMRLAEYQEGKTLIDVSGRRVRLEEYIIRKPREIAAADQDKAFKLVVLNERDDRFDYFYYRGLFNTSLPDDLSVALKDINGKLGTTAPTYYLTAYEMGQSNTADYIKDNASGGHLVKIKSESDGTYTLTDAADPTNTKSVKQDETTVVDNVTYHKIYDPVNDKYSTLTQADFAAGDFKPVVYDPGDDSFRNIATGDTYWRTRYNSYSHIINGASKQSYTPKTGVTNTLSIDDDATFTYAGGTLLGFTETPSGADKLHNRVTLFYGDGTKEIYDTYIISDEGQIAPTGAFSNVTTGVAFKAELLKWNYEQVATATEFSGRKIDLVVEPKILIKSGLIK